MKHITTLILTLVLSVSLVAQEKQNNFEIAKSLDIYNSLLRELNLNYVDEITPGELNETAIKAMLDGLDPYTVFIPESDIENAKFMTTGEYGGIGALIQYDGEYTRISDPYYGWPAQKAGIIAGDAIIEVNGVDAAYQIDGDYAFATWQDGSRIYSVSVYDRVDTVEDLLTALISAGA